MPSKSEYLKEIYYKKKNKKYSFFFYNLTSNSEDFSKTLRESSLNQFNFLILPSSFRLVKGPNIQGPRIGIFYTSNMKLKSLSFLIKLKGMTLKWDTKWYSPVLLNTLKFYKKEKDLIFQFLYICKISVISKSLV